MFTVNILVFLFFLIKTILWIKDKGDDFYFYLKCALISLSGFIYFFFMAKVSGVIMLYDGGYFYRDNAFLSNSVIIAVAAVYFALVMYPLIKLIGRRRSGK